MKWKLSIVKINATKMWHNNNIWKKLTAWGWEGHMEMIGSVVNRNLGNAYIERP
jgi:hypothetical protein